MTATFEKVEFTSAPTDTQMSNVLRDMESFLCKLAGLQLAEGAYVAGDPKLANVLHASAQLGGARKVIDGTSSLSLPQR